MPGAATSAVQRCFACVRLGHTLYIAADMGSLHALESSCLRKTVPGAVASANESCFARMQDHRLQPRHTHVSRITINACPSKEDKKKLFCERAALLGCIFMVGSILAVQHSSCFLTEYGFH